MFPRARALHVLALVSGSLAQVQQFLWGFTDSLSTSLPVCGSLPIMVTPAAVPGTPPFYMLAFAEGSAPTTQRIGTNASALSWTVDHPVGSKLILEVVDAHGASGGADIPLYAVVAGSTTACLPHAPANDFVVTSTTPSGGTLNTCDPWNLFVKGGKPPYNVTIAALNSTGVTNLTMAPTDTVFQYINRADPGSQMIAAISDSTGRWATGSPFVRTNGTADVTCAGRGSIGGNNDTIPFTLPPISSPSASPSLPPDSGSTHKSSAAIIGGAVGGAAVLLLLLAALAFLLCRKRDRNRTRTHDAKLLGTPPPVPFLTLTTPHRATASSVNLASPIDGADATPTPFLVADSGSRWSKSTPPTSDGSGHSRTGSAGSPSAVINMRELPPPYVTNHVPLPAGAAAAATFGADEGEWSPYSGSASPRAPSSSGASASEPGMAGVGAGTRSKSRRDLKGPGVAI
ncbi:hypothetical protein MKEN_00224800 [Mycena kentingensis (nom. inval.)]|nr:hypothetical protein MKEN_00224800 [Mycena kentingensis (nom. inval.)]